MSIPNTDAPDGVSTCDHPRHYSWHCRRVYWTVTSDLPSLSVYSNINEFDLCENMALQPCTQTTGLHPHQHYPHVHTTLSSMQSELTASHTRCNPPPTYPPTPPLVKRQGEKQTTCAHASGSPPWPHTQSRGAQASYQTVTKNH